MNIRSVINAAKEAIEATGMEVKTSSRSEKELLLGVRGKHRHRVFGPATPLVCWTDAYQYATGKNWVDLLTNWRKVQRKTPRIAVRQATRGEITVLTGTPFMVEMQLNELDRNHQLLSAIYTRRSSHNVIVHAEVI